MTHLLTYTALYTLHGALYEDVLFHIPAEVLDYRRISTVIIFNSSVSVNCLTLVVVDDNSLEQNETLMMSLSFVHDTYNVNFTQKSVTVEIMNDDGEIHMY